MTGFTPRLDDRIKAEFLALTSALLKIDIRQDAASLDGGALRLGSLEAPRDPDLPLLPDKLYPRIEPALAATATAALKPPSPPAEMVGRKHELDRLVAALLSGRAGALSGPGSTTLLRALAVDPRIRNGFRRIWWLDDLRDADVILGTALEAPGALIAASRAEQTATLRDMLTSTRTLLIIDSTAGMNHNPDGLAWALSLAPNVVIGVPSNVTPDGCFHLRMGGLPPDAAEAWLARLIERSGEVTRALAALVDYHPGALRVMAALITEDSLTPEAITALLAETPDAADSRLAALYAASFEALPEAYQALCTSLAALPRRAVPVASITAQFASPLAAQRALTFLERRCFVERLGDQERTIGNWAGRVVRSAQPLSADPHPGAVIRTAMRPASAPSDSYETALTLVDSLQDAEAAALLKTALETRRASGTHYGVAQALVALGRLAYLGGDDTGAASHIEAAAHILHELRDEAGLEVVRLALSRVYRRAGRPDAALSVLGDDAPPADLAAVYRARGAFAEAIQVYERWLADSEEAGDKTAAAMARLGLAETLIAANRPDEARRAVASDDSFGARWIRAALLHLSGNWAKACAAYEKLQADAPLEWRGIVARAHGRALAASGQVREGAMLIGAEGIWYEEKLGRPILARLRRSHALYAHLCLMLGDAGTAEESARRAHAVIGERPDPEAEAIACRVLGRIAAQAGAWEAAAVAFEAEITARNTAPVRSDDEIGLALHELGAAYAAQGQMDRSAASFRRALTHKDAARQPLGVVVTNLALAELLRTAGKGIEALEAGGRAVEILTRLPEADLALMGYALAWQARTQYAHGRPTRGADALEDWIARLAARLDEGLAHPHWGTQALAVGLALRGDAPLADPVAAIDQAENALRQCEAHAPESPAAAAARRDLGLLYVRLERPADALEVLTPLADHPGAAPAEAPFVLLAAHLGMARAHLALTHLNDGLAHFEKAFALEPDPALRCALFREAAEACSQAGQIERSAGYLAGALESLPREADFAGYVDLLVRLAYTRLGLRRFPEAIDTFEQAIAAVESAANPDSDLLARALADKAGAHFSLGQYKPAAETYRRALRFQNARKSTALRLGTLIGLARSEAQAGAHQAAAEAFYDALQFETLSPAQRRTLLAEQAEALVRIGQLQAAINAYDTALNLEDATPIERAELHRGLGAVYTSLGAHDQARKHLKAVLEAVQDDRTGTTLKILGDGYRAGGQIKEALETYQRALNYLRRDQSPLELAGAERALGELYLERSQFANAISHLEKGLEVERAMPSQQGGVITGILGNLARAHEMRGELDRAAVRHHEALVYQDHRHAPAQYMDTLAALGRIYNQLGKHTEAVRAYEEALRVDGQAQAAVVPAEADAARLRRDEMNFGLGVARRQLGALETAAAHLRLAAGTSHGELRSKAQHALEQVEAEIARHLKTLEAAEQSLTVIARMGSKDPLAVIFVRALQAQTSAALGRRDESSAHIRQMLDEIEAHGPRLTGDDPTRRALALLGQASDESSTGSRFAEAEALLKGDPHANSSLRWAVTVLAHDALRG